MKSARTWLGYACAAGGASLCTLIGLAMQGRFDIVNIAMVYLLPVVVVAQRFDRGAAIAGAVLCVVAFDLVFVPPQGVLSVDDAQYLLTFAVMLAVALIISGLTGSVRQQARAHAALELDAETQRIRGTLLASISHDLRTPLAVLVGASSSLVEAGERMSAEERAGLARSLYDQSKDMSDKVVKILEMTRLETGALAVDRDWVSLGEITGSVLDRLAERLAGHRVMVEMPDDLPLVRADAPLIEQALANLLENAARHTPAGTAVRVGARVREDQMVVSVEDFGPGIAEEDIERVFAMFHRVSSEGTPAGIGLGLAICRAIVHLHGGKLWAEKIPGGGTAFRFTLPAERPPAMPAETGGEGHV